MKRISTIMLFVMLAAFVAGFTVQASAQGQQSFYLTDDLAKTLKLTKSQVDAVNINHLNANYYLGQVAKDIADIDQKISEAQGTDQSPESIGATVGQLFVSRVALVRKGMALVKAYFADLGRVLTPAQQAQIRKIQGDVENANHTINLNNDAIGANLALPLPSTTTPVPTITNATSEADFVELAVAQFKATRAKEKLEMERKKLLAQDQ